MMLRCAPNFTSWKVDGSLLSKMDTTQHYRGWDMSTRNGIVEVSLVDESPKEIPPPPPPAPKGFKRPFKYSDLRGANPPKFVKEEVVKDAAKLKPKPAPTKAELKKPEVKKVAAAMPPKPVPPKDLTPKRAIRVAIVDPMPIDGSWKHIFFTYDGSGRAAGVKIYIDGKAAATKVVADTLRLEKTPSIRTTAPMQLGWRYPDADPAHDTRYQDIRLYGRALSAAEVKRLPYEDYAAEIASKPAQQWNEDQRHEIGDFYFKNVDPVTQSLTAEIAKLDDQLHEIAAGGDITLVSMERPTLAYADVLTRGVYTARAERVEANTPHFLPPLPAGEPHNRLALAKWTVSAENPLTTRVTVNRMWNEVFGAGLVETTEDFGIMGQRPSNPELLDWLAVEFRRSGWNVKHMYKLMVMSAAYRQSADSTPQQLAKDPKNLLLAHGPRFRMDAETLRDIALESSGLLANKIGGPSVKPYQPENVWEQVGYPSSDTLKYVQDHGDALYRRSLYTYWKRMVTMPDMDAFDAPMRDVVCTRRQRTDTPLQALVTMNDEQWVEASRALAQRAIQQGGKLPDRRIKIMGDILLAHDPPPKMMAVLESSLAKMQQHYAADPKAAHALIAVGESKSDPGISATELAAWTMIASEMLNLDETLNK
jgi:hypothetical protein